MLLSFQGLRLFDFEHCVIKSTFYQNFPSTIVEVCQELPVVLEIDPEKNGNTEHELPVGYWINFGSY
jgi:hypothetical protein